MNHPLADRLPPATRFLLEAVCLRGPPEPDPALSAEAVIAEARNQMIAGLLHQWAAERPTHPWSTPICASLAPDLQHHAIHALKLVKHTLDAVAVLEAAGIAVMVLKGPLLSKRYYGDFGIRHPGDVDLLVDEAAVVEADRALQAAGYQRYKPLRPLTGKRLQLYLDTQHEYGYITPTGGSLELHWRYSDSRRLFPEPFAQLWERGENIAAGGANLRTLSPPDTFFQLAIHGYTDGWSRLKWIADLPRVYAQLATHDLGAGIEAARRNGYFRVVELALALSGSQVTQADSRWLDTVLAYIANRLQNPHPRTLPTADRLRHAMAARRFHDALHDDAATRRSVAYCNLIMPADFDHLSLPDLCTPALPYLARGWRALRSLSI